MSVYLGFHRTLTAKQFKLFVHVYAEVIKMTRDDQRNLHNFKIRFYRADSFPQDKLWRS